MTRILIVDDDPSIASLLEALVGRMGFDTEVTLSSEQAADFIQKKHFDLLMTDLMMPGYDGLQLAEMALKQDPETMVILITGHASLQTALSALRLGIYDYILKPFKLEKVEHTIRSALEKKALKAENRTLKTELSGEKETWDIIGKSDALERVLHIIRKAAPTQTTILISGESGTGKELVAKAIHRHSERKHQPFISVNCGAIPENLLESDLFGFKKGAFTDARSDHVGRFIQANHGTLFLDEIGAMPRNLQVKLLRAIQEREIRPLGSSRSQKIDVRIIAASNANLRDMIQTGEFREDLYYRLNVIPIHVPPLRARKSDIPLLIKHFISKHGPVLNMKDACFTPEALMILQNYPWPGNVRQLENVVECSLALTTGDQIIQECDLPAELHDEHSKGPAILPQNDLNKTMEDLVADYERSLIRKALIDSHGVKTRAAKQLKINRTTLIEKMKRLNLSPNTGKEGR